jgi:hypothetical protein
MKLTSRPFQNPNKLLALHLWMVEFEKRNRYKPGDAEIVEAGLAASTSVVHYYYDEMEKLGMIFRPRKNGRAVPHSVIPLPLEQASPVIQNLIQKEK